MTSPGIIRSEPCAIFFLCFSVLFSIAITLLGEERANLSAFRTFDRFVLVWICRFPLPLDVWEGLRFVILALPGLFSYLFFLYIYLYKYWKPGKHYITKQQAHNVETTLIQYQDIERPLGSYFSFSLRTSYLLNVFLAEKCVNS